MHRVEGRLRSGVWALGNHRIVSVDDSDDLAVNGYVLAEQAVGIARSIDSLVVCSNHRDDVAIGDIGLLQNGHAGVDVAVHRVPFRGGQSAGLGQQLS